MRQTSPADAAPAAGFRLHPHYRTQRPLDATLLQVQSGLDEFITEKYADQIGANLAEWSASLCQSPRETRGLARFLADDFSGASPSPIESRVVRSNCGIEVRENKFAAQATLNRTDFLRDWQSRLNSFSKIRRAEFQITKIDAEATATSSSGQIPARQRTQVRYEIVGAGPTSYAEQRIGVWDLEWTQSLAGDFLLRRWLTLAETQTHSNSPIYLDFAAAAFGGNSSYAAQMLHGTDYWRTVLDGACGIDVYGHNGISVADIDGDGFDDVYVCQPAGLPNRLYRNRGDGTFEDATDSSGLGILENTACALFADFNNDGRQHAIVVRAKGPVLFLNDGHGRFHERPDAFHFANAPQGTFTGAAIADYDRDGWLDIYFCLYAYYQGTGQYKYPSPYHDARNGPPNFLMRNLRDGSFRDVTADAGLNLNNTRYSFCCGWSDYNHDGWPDLYVVNDFGRKNLYRNNRDGTFTDVAAQAGAEDTGAGMSVSWVDYDNDGDEDLYVADMWTAAGERVSTQPVFKQDCSAEVRGLYRKHAMGNSLLRNARGGVGKVEEGKVEGGKFEDATKRAGVGMGRWSWSSDAFDFDHDGYSDLYITNGMVSGVSRQDLNSFFWRQVVARSPDEARASLQYEQGWNAVNELIRSDGTWSGYERNVFYANNRDGTFSDISAVAGLDFVEDGRAFALADFDHDGRLEIFLKNRNAPQLRLLKNVVAELPPSILVCLKGTKSNRDAIGARVTIQTSEGLQTRMLQAGSGFLSQHSKEIFFGLGGAKGPVQGTIHWPSGLVQALHDLPANHRVWVEEGTASYRAELLKPNASSRSTTDAVTDAESLPATVESWLLAPISAPEFSLPDLAGRTQTLLSRRGKPVLLNFWTAKSPDCRQDLRALQKASAAWSAQGLQLITVSLEDTIDEPRAFASGQHFSFVILAGSDDVAAVYNIIYRQMFDRHRDLSLPTSFLVDEKGDIVKVYQGPISEKQVEQDCQRIPRTDA
jgi:peroxiredoxin